jgi:hypothetical protein
LASIYGRVGRVRIVWEAAIEGCPDSFLELALSDRGMSTGLDQ